MMLITKEYLKSLNPCEDRFDNYLEHYDNFSGSLEEFLDLSKLTHNDKKWVFVRSISKDKLRLIAADFAERVLHIYESKYPNDDRPRKAIETARSGNSADAARSAYAAYDAAYDAAYAADAADAAAYAAAAAAARSAYAAYADAAARSAYAAYDAAYADAAAYVAYADAADAAYAAYADAALLDEEKEQLEIMKKYAREALKGE